MIRIRALNEDSSDESGDEEVQTVTKEAQEQAAFQQYHKALESMTEEKYETAKEILENLLQSNLLAEVKKPENSEGFSQPVVALKYCCLKNMGKVLEHLGDLENSLNHYFKAAELDDSDVTLWYRMGMVAERALDYETACSAFEQGLQCSPHHWPCLEHLIVGLFVLDNYLPCLTYVGRGLEADAHFLTGLALRDHILQDFPGIETYFSSYCKEYDLLIGQVDYDIKEGKKIVEDALKQKKARQDMIDQSKTPAELKTVGLLKPLPSKTWLGIGECLLQLHHHIHANSENLESCCPVDMLLVCSKAEVEKKVSVDEKEDNENQEEKETKVAPTEIAGDSDETKSKKRRRNALNFLEQWMWGGQRRSARVRSSTVRKEVEREECNLGEALRHLVPAALLPNTTKEVKKETANPKSGEDSSDTMELYRMFQRRESGDEKKDEYRAMSPNSKEELKLLKEEGYFLVAAEFLPSCENGKAITDDVANSENLPETECDSGVGSREGVTKSIVGVELKIDVVSRRADGAYGINLHDKITTGSVLNSEGKKRGSECLPSVRREMDADHTVSDGKKASGKGIDEGSKEELKIISCPEVLDVVKYIEEYNHENIIQLLNQLVIALGGKWCLRWPSKLISTFMNSYVCMRKDVRHYSIFEIEEPEHFSILVKDAWSTLLYMELYLDRWFAESCKSHQEFKFADVAEAVGQLMMMSGQQNLLGESYRMFVVRVWWLLSHIYLVTGDISASMQYLEELMEFFTEECKEIRLPNCKFYKLISKDTVSKFLSELMSNQNLCKVQQLHSDQRYEELVVVLKGTFQCHQQKEHHLLLLGIPSQCSPTVDRPTQMALLLHALWHLNRYKECFYWGEVCCNEAFQKYLNCEEGEQQKWASTIEKLLAALESCINKWGLSVMDKLESASRVGRLVQNLTHIVCHQMEAPETAIEMPIETVLPWILLQQVLQRYHEKRVGNNSYEESYPIELPGYIQVLFTAHEYLGRRSWCCSNEGSLLLYTMDVLIPKLKDESLVRFRDKLKQGLEQAFYCLYGHPNRKNKLKHLQDHGVPQIALDWEHSLQLFQFCQPVELPEFDSNHVPSISSDVEPLFKRIISLVPDDCSPVPLVEKMGRYIDGTSPQVPALGEHSSKLPRQVSNIYYLLADFYFKNNEWSKAIRHYLLDVCVNPLRLDSWAGMALARGSLLEMKLNSCDPLRNESEFLRQAATARRCFQRALEIDPRHSVLWIEYGSFVYMVHSFCSRVLKQQAVNLSIEMWTIIEKQKEEMLDLAVKCFTEANKVWLAHGEECGLQDERWLHHYMLGKVAEKREDNPCTSLNHYIQSCKYLSNNKASFTLKLNYNNPPFLAVEVLEVVYRIHACILKYLEQHEGQVIPKKTNKLFSRHLQEVESGPFMAAIKELDKKSDSEEESRKRSATDALLSDLEHLEFSQPLFGTMPADMQIITDVIEVMEMLLSKISAMTSDSTKENKASSQFHTVSMSIKNEEEKHSIETKIKPLELGDGSNVKLLDYRQECMKKSDLSAMEPDANNGIGKARKWLSDSGDCAVKAEKDENVYKITEVKHDKNLVKDNIAFRSVMKEESDAEKMETESVGREKDSVQQGSREGSTTTGTTTETSSGNSSSSSSDESSSSDDSSDSSSSSKSDDSSDSGSETATKINETVIERKKSTDSAGKKNEVEKDEENESDSEQDGDNEDHYTLISKCLVLLEECVIRFPQHYKSVYRLAHYYFYSKFHRNVQKCRDLLLGTHKCLPFQNRFADTTIQGLFLERKNNNFFNGIWRIPSSEIDRPGSFASHMSRCMTLLMEILREQKDQKLLMELAVQLSRIPEADKKYLRDGEREQLSRQAVTLCQQSVRVKLLQAGENVTSALLMEVFHCYQRVQKHFSNKESSFASLVMDAYKRHAKVKDVSLEQVVRFCQAEFISSRIQAKTKVMSSTEPSTPVSSSSVSFTTIVSSQSQQQQVQQQPQQQHQQVQPPQQQQQHVQQPPPPAPPPQQPQQQQQQQQQQKKLPTPATSTASPLSSVTISVSQSQPAKPRGRPPNVNRAASKNAVGNWGVGSLPPFPAALSAMSYPFMFGDTNMLASSMRSGVTPTMEQQLAAFNLMNLHAQLGSYQAEFLRHFASNSGNMSQSLLASLATHGLPPLGAGLSSFPPFSSSSSSSQQKLHAVSSKDKQNSTSSKVLSSKVPPAGSKLPATSKSSPPTVPKVSTTTVSSVASKVTQPVVSKVSPPAASKGQPAVVLPKAMPKEPLKMFGPSLQQKLQATSQAFSEALARSAAASSNSSPGNSSQAKYPSPSSPQGSKHKSKTESIISVQSTATTVEKNSGTSKLISFRKQPTSKISNGSGKELKDAYNSNAGSRVQNDFTKVSSLLQNIDAISKNTEENIKSSHVSSKPKEISYNTKVTSTVAPSYKSCSNISVVDLSPVKNGSQSNVTLKNLGHEITVCPPGTSVLKRSAKQSPSQLEILKKPKMSSPLGSLSIPSSITITPKQADSSPGSRDISSNTRIKDCVSITEVVRSKNSSGVVRNILPDSDVVLTHEKKKDDDDDVEIITLD